ncbi:MAG: ACP S-malonyltransferase [Ruminiclostridium sp.]|nr:ACP S-malonyltransferase [Ruminiclostridium sp.]
MKTAFLFSGQGSQYPVMGKELFEAYPEKAKTIIEAADKTLDFDLWSLIQNGSAEELAQTRVSQPAIFTVSLLALMAAKENGIEYEGAAGHSLGEYAAMVASGILTVDEGYIAIKHRADAMDRAAKANPGAMAAIIGLPAEKVTDVCEEIAVGGDYVTAVNFNSPVQTVIAGTKEAVAKASETAKAAGAKRALPLAVSAAFHSEFMKPAAEEFKIAVKDMNFKTPDVKFYSNVTGAELTDFSDMPELMSRHICSPVRFTDELNAMKKDGFDVFVELGPGKVLTGLVGKTLKEVKAVNIENTESLKVALEHLKP